MSEPVYRLSERDLQSIEHIAGICRRDGLVNAAAELDAIATRAARAPLEPEPELPPGPAPFTF